MADLRSMLQQRLLGMAGGQGASQNLGSAAHRQAQSQAMGVGSSMAGVSPALAARQAQQAAAMGSVGADVERARMQAQEQSQALPMLAQMAAQDQSREDMFLGAGLDAGGAALGMLMGGGKGQQAPTQAPAGLSMLTGGMGGQQAPTQAPAQTPAAPAAAAPSSPSAPQNSGGSPGGGGAPQNYGVNASGGNQALSSLLNVGGMAAGTSIGGPLGGMLGGNLGNMLGGLFGG